MKYLFLVLLLVGCSPKFKVGDCVKNKYYEAWEDYYIYKIIQIGHDHYLYSSYSIAEKQFFLIKSYFPLIENIDNNYVKIDCPKEIQSKGKK